MIRIRQIIRFTLALCISMGESNHISAQAQHRSKLPPKIYERLSTVTVKILCDGGAQAGSGTIVGIGNQGIALVLTAAHVIVTNFEETDPGIPLEFCKSLTINIETAVHPLRAIVLPNFVDKGNDIALIATYKSTLQDEVVTYTRSANVAREQFVRALGFPQTDELRQTTGRIIEVGKNLVFDAIIDHGSSGGPLIDEKGRMIGLSTSRVKVEGQQIGYAVPIDLVASIVSRWLRPLKLKKKWQLEQDGSFFYSPVFIGSVVASVGTVFWIWRKQGERGFPSPPGRPPSN